METKISEGVELLFYLCIPEYSYRPHLWMEALEIAATVA
jgi:hypothetical protein